MDKTAIVTKITADRTEKYSHDEMVEITTDLLALSAEEIKEVILSIASREDEPSRELMQHLGACEDLYLKVIAAFGGPGAIVE